MFSPIRSYRRVAAFVVVLVIFSTALADAASHKTHTADTNANKHATVTNTDKHTTNQNQNGFKGHTAMTTVSSDVVEFMARQKSKVRPLFGEMEVPQDNVCVEWIQVTGFSPLPARQSLVGWRWATAKEENGECTTYGALIPCYPGPGVLTSSFGTAVESGISQYSNCVAGFQNGSTLNWYGEYLIPAVPGTIGALQPLTANSGRRQTPSAFVAERQSPRKQENPKMSVKSQTVRHEKPSTPSARRQVGDSGNGGKSEKLEKRGSPSAKSLELPAVPAATGNWIWSPSRIGNVIPDTAIRAGNAVVVRMSGEPAGSCLGQYFIGWGFVGTDPSTGEESFAFSSFSVGGEIYSPREFEVAICQPPTPAPTPQPPTPQPGPTPAPTPVPAGDAVPLRFANTIPSPNLATVTISQLGVSRQTFPDTGFAHFSEWTYDFRAGVTDITVSDSATSHVFFTTRVVLPPGPTFIALRGYWPPQYGNESIEVISDSHKTLPPTADHSMIRLFNLCPDVHFAGLMNLNTDEVLANGVGWSAGSPWKNIAISPATLEAFNTDGFVSVARNTTTPPRPPRVVTMFLIGLSSQGQGSPFAARLIPAVDAPETP